MDSNSPSEYMLGLSDLLLMNRKWQKHQCVMFETRSQKAFLTLSLSLYNFSFCGITATVFWRQSFSPPERSMWQGAEFLLPPATRNLSGIQDGIQAILEGNPPATVWSLCSRWLQPMLTSWLQPPERPWVITTQLSHFWIPDHRNWMR